MSTNTPPPHPGEVLVNEYLKPKELTQKQLANQLKVSPPRVNYLVTKSRLVSPSMAIKLADVTGIKSEEWLRLSREYEAWAKSQPKVEAESAPVQRSNRMPLDENPTHALLIEKWKNDRVNTLSDRHILEAVQTGYLKIKEFDEDAVQPHSYDCHIGEDVLVKTNGKTQHRLGDEELNISPGQLAVVKTLETLDLPAHIKARFSPMSWLSQYGVFINSGIVDATYSGPLFITLMVGGNLELEINSGTPFLTLEFEFLPIAPNQTHKNYRPDDGVAFTEAEQKLIQAETPATSESKSQQRPAPAEDE